MSHSHSTSAMDMSTMKVAFFSSTSTPLYSSAWTPGSTGAYTGTCIFLILLAVLFRCLAAGKQILERRWLDQELNRRYIRVQGIPTEAERIEFDPSSKPVTLITERGVEEHVQVVRKTRRAVTPWRHSVDVPRAAFVTLTAGVGYLL
ncbi:MAG: hypothetical protein Q9220_000038 [cf. Caloplaca sp. 1 TL-2023]